MLKGVYKSYFEVRNQKVQKKNLLMYEKILRHLNYSRDTAMRNTSDVIDDKSIASERSLSQV
jgi:hypothetical protein